MKERGLSRRGLIGVFALLGLVVLAFVAGKAYNTAERQMRPNDGAATAPDFIPDSPEDVAVIKDERLRCARLLSTLADRIGAGESQGNVRKLAQEMFDALEAEDLKLSAREPSYVAADRSFERERIAQSVYAVADKSDAEWMQRQRAQLQSDLLRAQIDAARAQRDAAEAQRGATTPGNAVSEPTPVGGTGWAWYEEKVAKEKEAKRRAAIEAAKAWRAEQDDRDHKLLQDLEGQIQDLQAAMDREMQRRLNRQH